MGLAGSLHCAGMCSPLAMAVANKGSSAMLNRILYNAGRIVMYGFLGAIVGAVGYLLPLSKYQNIMSIGLGVALFAMAMSGISSVRIPVVTPVSLRFTSMLKRIFSKFIQRKSVGAMLLLGSLNGLLPCGLTLVALSVCITLSKPVQGFAYMFVFGLGTLPVMLGLVSIASLVTNRFHWNIKAVTTALMAISGVLLIVRVFLVHVPETHLNSGIVDIVICR